MTRPFGLRRVFGERLQERISLARFTSSRTGGTADWLIQVRSADELRRTAVRLWEIGERFRVLGGGSNVLVADAGVREVVVLNEARDVRFEAGDLTTRVTAESGASLGSLARRSAARGLTGPGGGGGKRGGSSPTAGAGPGAPGPGGWPLRRFSSRRHPHRK